MLKKILLISFFFIISCSSLKTTPMSKYNLKEISKIASNYVYEKNGENIEYEDISIYKKKYGIWNIDLYGLKKIYFLTLDEDGNVLKYEEKSFKK